MNICTSVMARPSGSDFKVKRVYFGLMADKMETKPKPPYCVQRRTQFTYDQLSFLDIEFRGRFFPEHFCNSSIARKFGLKNTKSIDGLMIGT